MNKVISIVGARPQFIKLGIVSKKIRKKSIREVLVHTGQHYDENMSDSFFQELDIPKPDYHLGIGSGSHGQQTGRMIMDVEKVLQKEKPDLVMVFGDTNSVLGGALAAAKLNYPIAHIESGVRTYNKSIPEEINRLLTDHISALLFAPTELAVDNLKKEGITRGVYHVGDVMLDIALDIKRRTSDADTLKKYDLKEKNYILATIHRAENTDIRENLENIWLALKTVSADGLSVVFPLHPRTRKALAAGGFLVASLPSNLQVIDPIPYSEMLSLEANARLIITDSGGVQREGYFFHTPCIVPKKETSWPELIDIQWNVLTGARHNKIVEAVESLWDKNFKKKAWIPFFGEGNAADKIADIVSTYLNVGYFNGETIAPKM